MASGEMNLLLRPATASEIEASESLSRLNMAGYRASRGVPWDPDRFRQSWEQFENLAIACGSQRCGFIRLMPEGDALAIRDLQIAPGFQGKGIGTWAIEEVKQMAAARGYGLVQLRVYPENPAMSLYARLGFVPDYIQDSVLHMRCHLAPGG
jgi:ribosomal protein S18 acetylase RimI-like enzyme